METVNTITADFEPVTKARVTELFKGLRKRGLLARQNHMCCGTCAGYSCFQDMKPRHIGNVNYNRQSMSAFDDQWMLESSLYLSYGGRADDDRVEGGLTDKEVGDIIVEVAAELGIPVDWNGSEHKCVCVVPHGHRHVHDVRDLRDRLVRWYDINPEMVVREDDSAYLLLSASDFETAKNHLGYGRLIQHLEDGRVAVE